MAFYAPSIGDRTNMICDGDYKRYDKDGELVTCARPPIPWHWRENVSIDDYVDLSQIAGEEN